MTTEYRIGSVAISCAARADIPLPGPRTCEAAHRVPVTHRVQVSFEPVRAGGVRPRGLRVLGRFGQGSWRVVYAGRSLYWTADGRDLDRVHVRVARIGDTARDGYAVRSAVRFLCAETLLRTGGVALHAAAVARAGRAAVFMARAGGGKTTLVRRFGRADALGDDFCVVAPGEDRLQVFPSPVSGREGTPVLADAAPLGWLCELEKAAVTRVEPMRTSDQVAAVLRHAILFTRERAAREALLDIAIRLVREVGVVRLFQSLDAAPWEVLCDA